MVPGGDDSDPEEQRRRGQGQDGQELEPASHPGATRALDRMPDEYRQVVTLSRRGGLSHAEVAAELGKTEGATRMLLHRALARLGVELNAS